jgi:hypothetical protein
MDDLPNPDDLVITTQHIYTVPAWSGDIGFCARGARAWFARHDLDWSDFVVNGIPASVLLATDDALAQQVVDHALAEASIEVNNG